MRLLLIAALLIAAPLPAMAQDATPEIGALAERLTDPATQEQAAAVTGVLMRALMEMPVGPLIEAMDGVAEEMDMPASPPTIIAPDARLRDVVGPQGDAAAMQLARRMPEMMETMADMAGTLEGMMPHLREMAQRLPRRLPDAE
ncbi:MAG: hypothetical protein WBA68_07985 [Alteraurantiacibacter sp.]